jgi:hypothetical protein
MHGYSVAAAFFFLAAASAVVSALMARRRQSKRWSALLWFFVYMALFAVGYLAIYAAQSASHCYGSSQTYDDMEAEADSTICHGFAFAAIVAAMGVLTGFYFAFLCYRSRYARYEITHLHVPSLVQGRMHQLLAHHIILGKTLQKYGWAGSAGLASCTLRRRLHQLRMRKCIANTPITLDCATATALEASSISLQ